MMLLRVVMVVVMSASSLVAAELTGRQIMEKQEELHKVGSEYGQEVMMIQDLKAKSNEKRNIRRYAKETDEGLSRSMVAFLSPADVAGTAILTWEQKSEDDQWIYMPATKKMQRIASGSKKNYFMGTDFTYEDIAPEDIENFNYTVLKTETLPITDKFTIKKTEKIAGSKKDWKCWVIEAVPANKEKKKSSGYSKRLLWVDQEYFVSLKIEFYDRRNKLIKTQWLMDLENITGTVWRPAKTWMENTSKKSRTLTLVSKREVNQDIADEVFTERFILTGKHVE